MRALIVAVLALVLGAGVALGATPRQATTRLGACFQAHGAKATKTSARWSSAAYVRWSYVTVNGQVGGLAVVWGRLTPRQKRGANVCLRPYHGHVL
jgi:hypothetical protein